MSTPDLDKRTLDPTPKRVQDFRKRGEIALSRDTVMVATFGCGAFTGLSFFTTSRNALFEACRIIFGAAGTSAIGIDEAIQVCARAVIVAIAPLTIGAFVGYAVTTIVQLGFPPAFMKPKFDLGRVFSAQSLGNIFNPKAAAGRTAKSFAKITFVAFAAGMALLHEHERFLKSPALEPVPLIERVRDASFNVSLYAGLALALLAAVEYGQAIRTIRGKMRMTHEEMKREMRDMEGDPQIKRRRRQRMRELSRRRLVESVKTADVVVVNPTEYAVALRYKVGKDRAPVVVAKGRKAVAEKIREIARGAGIPILSQPPLARLLHKIVPEGREVPGNVYKAVAEILAHVYRLKRRGR